MMKTNLIASLALIGAALLAVPAHAQKSAAPVKEGPWLMRLRALDIQPANKSDAFGNVSSNAIKVNSKWFPEVDVSYFFTPNIAAELVLTYPQKQTVKLNGDSLGSFKHLPPTLSAQYHFVIPKSPFKPYVGLGLNYTRISDVNLASGTTALSLSSSSTGIAIGAGVDYKVTEKVYVNLDYKYVDLKSDVKVKDTGAKLTKVKLNPDLASVGVGYRF